jgi:hypothetical protein
MTPALPIFDFAFSFVALLTEKAPLTCAALASDPETMIEKFEQWYADYTALAKSEPKHANPHRQMTHIINAQLSIFPEEFATEPTAIPFLDDLPTILDHRANGR